MTRHRRLVGFLMMLLISAALALSLERLTPLDLKVSAFLAERRGPVLTPFFLFVTQLASPLALIIGSLCLLLVVRRQHYQVPLFANLIISVMLNLGLKDIFVRPRPQGLYPLVLESGFSFPSGHAMAALSFYGFAVYLLKRSVRSFPRGRSLRLGAGLLIGLVGLSRVYLGVHYLSDVVGGFAVAGAYLLAYTAFVSAYFAQDRSLAGDLAAGRPRLAYSLAHAMDGLVSGLKAERNMIIHFGVMALATVFGLLLRLSALEWCVLLIFFALVIGAELINTAIEATVDLVTKERHPAAKLAKDTAAAGVLVCALAAALAGLIIFLPKVLRLLGVLL